MIITPIASGSAGNAYLISDGEDTILIEAGIPIKDLKIATNNRLTRLRGVLVSHQHNDHAKSVKELIEKYAVDVYAPQEVFTAKNVKGHHCHALEERSQLTINNFNIQPFLCEHDVTNFGYLIYSHRTKETLLYFTDTYYIKYKFKGLTHIMAECNYSKEAVDHAVKKGYVPEIVRSRLLDTHMSIDHFSEMLEANDLKQLQQIYLLHLSDNNSNAEEFKERVQKKTGVEVYVC